MKSQASHPPASHLSMPNDEEPFFVPQSMSLPAPKEWTFHSLPIQGTQSPVPSPHYKPETQATHTSNFDHKSVQGYFHHAKHRITTNIDIGALAHKEVLDEIIKRVQGFNTDEFTEVIVTPISDSGLPVGADKREYELRYADHFSRVLSSEVDDNFDPRVNYDYSSTYTQNYYKWVKQMMTSPTNHLLLPSASPKEYNCLGRKIAQQVVWDHQNGHITKVDVEDAFSMSECTSLLSALQKKRVTDKQCQNIIATVLKRFLLARPFKQPILAPTFSTRKTKEEYRKITRICVFVVIFIWHGPMFSIPSSYFRRLKTLAERADNAEFLPHLWRTFIKGLVKEWAMLNIVLALILAANIGFLALPGTSRNPSDPNYQSSALADLSRGAGLISMFTTLGGLLTGLSLIWLHQPLQGTGSLDACRYILGPSYKQSQDPEAQSESRRVLKLCRLAWMATYLGLPLIFLSWSVVAFTISAIAWTFLFSGFATQMAVVVFCGFVLISPLITLVVFWRPIVAKDCLFAKMLRADSDFDQ